MTSDKAATGARNASVEFRSVTKCYGQVKAVDAVSFTIRQGQLMTLLGPSGCGKTTTLRMIAGLEMPSEGQIFIGGEDVTLRSAADRNVSMVFQSYALFPHMSVIENVAYGPSVQGLKQRQDIRELQQRLNLTVAYVTHDQEEALAVSDEIVVMNNARIAQRGTPHMLYQEPADLFIVDFIGDANILDVEICSVVDHTAHILFGTLPLALPARGLGKGLAKMAIRPDAITLSHSGGFIEGIVKKAFFLGRLWEYTIATEVGELFVTIPGRTAPYQIGGSVSLNFDSAGMVLVPSV